MHETQYSLFPIGFLRSPLRDRGAAPNQGREGAPDAWLEVDAAVADGLNGIEVGGFPHRDYLVAPGAARYLENAPAQ
jgi:tRNA (Thr-GGU) A37 N-methylase